MNMNKYVALAAIVGFIVGTQATSLFPQKPAAMPTPTPVPQSASTGHVMSAHTDSHEDSMTMQEMTNSLKGKTGDAFDKAFIIGMIEHHEGAVDMAIEAKKNAGHEEIKTLADEIIAAQTKEIEMMKQWLTDWGLSQ